MTICFMGLRFVFQEQGSAAEFSALRLLYLKRTPARCELRKLARTLLSAVINAGSTRRLFLLGQHSLC